MWGSSRRVILEGAPEPPFTSARPRLRHDRRRDRGVRRVGVLLRVPIRRVGHGPDLVGGPVAPPRRGSVSDHPDERLPLPILLPTYRGRRLPAAGVPHLETARITFVAGGRGPPRLRHRPRTDLSLAHVSWSPVPRLRTQRKLVGHFDRRHAPTLAGLDRSRQTQRGHRDAGAGKEQAQRSGDRRGRRGTPCCEPRDRADVAVGMARGASRLYPLSPTHRPARRVRDAGRPALLARPRRASPPRTRRDSANRVLLRGVARVPRREGPKAGDHHRTQHSRRDGHQGLLSRSSRFQ